LAPALTAYPLSLTQTSRCAAVYMPAERRREGGCGARSMGRKQSHAGRRISYTVRYCRFIGAQHQDWFLGLFLFVHCDYALSKFGSPHYRCPEETRHIGINSTAIAPERSVSGAARQACGACAAVAFRAL